MMAYVLLAVYVASSALGMVLIKKGGFQTKFFLNKNEVGGTISWIFMIGIVFYVLSFLLWIYILQLFPLAYISPIAYGLTFIAITILSYLVLSVEVSRQQIVGAVFIIVGIFIASVSSK